MLCNLVICLLDLYKLSFALRMSLAMHSKFYQCTSPGIQQRLVSHKRGFLICEVIQERASARKGRATTFIRHSGSSLRKYMFVSSRDPFVRFIGRMNGCRPGSAHGQTLYNNNSERLDLKSEYVSRLFPLLIRCLFNFH